MFLVTYYEEFYGHTETQRSSVSWRFSWRCFELQSNIMQCFLWKNLLCVSAWNLPTNWCIV